VKPVLVLGGRDNALSIARSLGRKGVPVFLSVEADSVIYHSRYCPRRYSFDSAENARAYWTRLLLNEPVRELENAIVLACSDDAVEFLAKHRSELERHYTLDLFDPDIQLAMLDKAETLALAAEHGCSVPGSFDVSSDFDAAQLPAGMQFPLLIKPKLSHLFQRAFDGRKFLLVGDEQELKEGLVLVRATGLDVMLCEWIPGPDSLLCSYYTYIDEHDQILFDYTKRIIRRYPVGEGGGTYHATEWLPDVAEEGIKFFKGIGFTGFGNIEFKRDPRDGRLKVMECNPRFTAAQELLARSGFDIADFIYSRLTNSVPPILDEYEQDLRLWHPIPDFKSFLELRRRGEMRFIQWVRSICRGSKVFPLFRLYDPMPSIVWHGRYVSLVAKNRLGLQ